MKRKIEKNVNEPKKIIKIENPIFPDEILSIIIEYLGFQSQSAFFKACKKYYEVFFKHDLSIVFQLRSFYQDILTNFDFFVKAENQRKIKAFTIGIKEALSELSADKNFSKEVDLNLNNFEITYIMENSKSIENAPFGVEGMTLEIDFKIHENLFTLEYSGNYDRYNDRREFQLWYVKNFEITKIINISLNLYEGDQEYQITDTYVNFECLIECLKVSNINDVTVILETITNKIFQHSTQLEYNYNNIEDKETIIFDKIKEYLNNNFKKKKINSENGKFHMRKNHWSENLTKLHSLLIKVGEDEFLYLKSKLIMGTLNFLFQTEWENVSSYDEGFIEIKNLIKSLKIIKYEKSDINIENSGFYSGGVREYDVKFLFSLEKKIFFCHFVDFDNEGSQILIIMKEIIDYDINSFQFPDFNNNKNKLFDYKNGKYKFNKFGNSKFKSYFKCFNLNDSNFKKFIFSIFSIIVFDYKNEIDSLLKKKNDEFQDTEFNIEFENDKSESNESENENSDIGESENGENSN
jgi:hypothetical protein